jgi:transcriptional regulator with XRE-family HTH domain
MGNRKRLRCATESAREAARAAMRLGEGIRLARRRRRLTQRALGARVGLHHSRISQVELGRGATLPLRDWFALADGVGRPLRVDLLRSADAEPLDAGHLKMQELVLQLARQAGLRATFELPTRPAEPWRSTDVGLRDDRRRQLLLVECWNTFGDVGAAARATNRKLAEAAGLAAALGGDGGPYRVEGCWVVRAGAANRALVARYPEVFSSRFPGSSANWMRAIAHGSRAPEAAGLVWCSVDGRRLFAWRRHAHSH